MINSRRILIKTGMKVNRFGFVSAQIIFSLYSKCICPSHLGNQTQPHINSLNSSSKKEKPLSLSLINICQTENRSFWTILKSFFGEIKYV